MKDLRVLMQDHFLQMCKKGKLFTVDIPKNKIWDIYLKSFPNDLIFKTEGTHNCNNCKNFLKRYGNIVAIDENLEIETIFGIEVDGEYKLAMENLDNFIKTGKINGLFFENFDDLKELPYESCSLSQNTFKLSVEKNRKIYTHEEVIGTSLEAGKVYTFHHFGLDLPTEFVDKSTNSRDSLLSDCRSSYNVFKRTMEEIPLDTLKLVRDLITQGSLLNGESHLYKVNGIMLLKEEYNSVQLSKRDNWCWINSYKNKLSRFRNELIGVLCTELAEGEDLNKACLNWNKRVDPANYMKAVAPLSETQKKNAQKFIEDNGYVESFNRRFATIDDINISEIIHVNSGNGCIKQASIFDKIKTTSRHKRAEFNKIEEIHIDKFMSDILPTCESVELFLENKFKNNLVTLTTSTSQNAKQIFKWSNPFSWTYNGNLAGKSLIKESVKSQGGKVNGVLRFSIMWSEGNSDDDSDLDAHCLIKPSGKTICFSNKEDRETQGNLDIDIVNPLIHKRKGKNVVENITFPTLEKLSEGKYVFIVHQYSAANSQGFKAEIEFNGESYEYEYNQPVTGKIKVAEVTFKNGEFSIKHLLPSIISSKEVWGLETQKFHRVNLISLSPNFWGENNIGNRHYFFMLDKCYSDSSIRSFHTENLLPELVEHRKVLDVLGNVTMIEPTNEPAKQLAGIGFNATVRDHVVLRVKGSHKRIIKVIF